MNWTMLVLGFLACGWGGKFAVYGGIALMVGAIALEVADRTVWCWT